MSIQNTKKTIYLVGTNKFKPQPTIEAIKTINKSECVILSDKPKKFISQLKRINTRLCLVRQLSTTKGIYRFCL